MKTGCVYVSLRVKDRQVVFKIASSLHAVNCWKCYIPGEIPRVTGKQGRPGNAKIELVTSASWKTRSYSTVRLLRHCHLFWRVFEALFLYKFEYPKKRYAAGISEDERPEAFDGFVSLFSKNCLIKKKIPVQQS